MKMIHLILALLVGMAGGGFVYDYQRTPAPTATIDDQFYYLIKDFEDRWGHQLTTVSVQLAPALEITYEDGGATFDLGQCYMYVLPRQIWISREVWNNLSQDDREEVLLHELGHCLFLLEHDLRPMVDKGGNPVTVDGHACPRSVMYPTVDVVKPCYRKYREYYWNELLRHSRY